MEDNTIETIDMNEDGSSEVEENIYADKELDENVLQRLKNNDPAITHVNIHFNCNSQGHSNYNDDYFFNSIDWKVDGDCIANNTHLKKMVLSYRCRGVVIGKARCKQPYTLGEQGHSLPTRNQLQDFFSCIYRNQSITKLYIRLAGIDDEFGGGLIEGLCGHQSLERLQIGSIFDELHVANIGSIGCSAIGKVLNHPESKLKDLRLPYCQLDGEKILRLTDVLMGNSTLKRLHLDGNRISIPGWRALSTVISDPNCKLIELGLVNTEIDDEGAAVLGRGIRGSSLMTLSLASNNSIRSAGYPRCNHSISSRGWQTLFNQLSQTSVERLNLRSLNINNNNKIDDTSLTLLASIGTLKSLNLSSNNSITPLGWRSFFVSLQTRGTQLVKLDISCNKIGGVSLVSLGNLLSSMNTLKILNMSNMEYSITSQGWVSLFTTLHGSNMNLVKLSLGENTIDDEGLQLLVRLISSMTSMKELSLGDNKQVTPVGWQALIGYLRSPSFELRELHLSCNNINDDTVVAFTRHLSSTNNKTLEWLTLEYCYDEDDNDLITERGWDAISALICNKTSIMDTYKSNHTLDALGDLDEMNLPDDLDSNLDLNQNQDKTEVARQKILQTHYSDASNIQEFLDMELEMMPIAIAWIGRLTPIGWNGTKVSGWSTMYNLMRRLPDLFDSGAHKKKSTVRGSVICS